MDIMEEIRKKRLGEDRDYESVSQIIKESAPDMTAISREYAPVIDKIIRDFGVSSEYGIYVEDGHPYMCIPTAFADPKDIESYTYSTEGEFTVVQLDAMNKEAGCASASTSGYNNATYSDKEKKSKTVKHNVRTGQIYDVEGAEFEVLSVENYKVTVEVREAFGDVYQAEFSVEEFEGLLRQIHARLIKSKTKKSWDDYDEDEYSNDYRRMFEPFGGLNRRYAETVARYIKDNPDLTAEDISAMVLDDEDFGYDLTKEEWDEFISEIQLRMPVNKSKTEKSKVRKSMESEIRDALDYDGFDYKMRVKARVIEITLFNTYSDNLIDRLEGILPSDAEIVLAEPQGGNTYIEIMNYD